MAMAISLNTLRSKAIMFHTNTNSTAAAAATATTASATSDESETTCHQGWHQDEHDLPFRREMIHRLTDLVGGSLPLSTVAAGSAAATSWQQQRLRMARLVEVCLYQEAASLETYADVTTLQERLHRLQPHNHPQMLQDQSQDAQAPEGKMPPWHAFRNQPLVAAVNSEAPTGTAACTAAAAGRATDVGNAAIAADAVDWHQLEDHLPHRREMIQRLVALLHSPTTSSRTASPAATTYQDNDAWGQGDNTWDIYGQQEIEYRRLWHMAQHVEVCLYREARSLHAYCDDTTLRERLRRIARQLCAARHRRAVLGIGTKAPNSAAV